jgi:hypothetical protein
VRDFFAALWAHWISRMSGIVSVLLGAYAIFYPRPISPRSLFVVGAIGAFAIAAFDIFRREHLAHLRTAAELNNERSRRPRPKLVPVYTIRFRYEKEKVVPLSLENTGPEDAFDAAVSGFRLGPYDVSFDVVPRVGAGDSAYVPTNVREWSTGAELVDTDRFDTALRDGFLASAVSKQLTAQRELRIQYKDYSDNRYETRFMLEIDVPAATVSWRHVSDVLVTV